MRMVPMRMIGLLLTVIMGLQLHAQGNKVPPFKMRKTDGSVFSAAQFPIGKPMMIIYFSPDCDHCQLFMEQFFQKPKSFRKASIAMVTFLPMEKLQGFSTKYKLSDHQNIYAGTENGSMYLKNYYGMHELPFVALYDKLGNLVTRSEKDIDLTSLETKLKSL